MPSQQMGRSVSRQETMYMHQLCLLKAQFLAGNVQMSIYFEIRCLWLMGMEMRLSFEFITLYTLQKYNDIKV